MRILLAIVLLLGVFTASAQKNKFKGAGFDYTKTAPNYIPVRGTESEIAIDSLTGKWMQYSYQSAEWRHLGYFVTETGTSGSPSYTPNKVKSVMAINAGDSLYHYRAGTWYLIAGGGGAGITDGDKGDVDVTDGGTVWTIDTGAITMIKINQAGAAVGQVIKWNGTAWAPADDETSATGAGGLYGPSDLVTYNHVATLDSGLTFSSAEDTAYFRIIMAPGAFGMAAYFNSDSIRLRRYDVGGSNELILNADGVLLKTTGPDRVTIEGADARSAADYRATYSARSFIDKQYGDDFYLQEVDSLRVSNDTLYISLARDSVPEKFVVLPASDDTSGYNLDFRISNDTLYIEDADGALFVDLEPYKDNTDTSGYNLGARISGDTLYIRDGDGEVSVALPADSDGQTLSIDSVSLESGERFIITISDGNSVSFDVPADTDNQTLDTFDIASNVLRASLTDDGVPFKSVDLAPYLDNTDTSGYNLSFTRSNDTLYLSDGDGTLFVKLPAAVATDTSGYNLQVRISGDTLYIRDGDGELSASLAAYLDNTDGQTLSVDSADIGGIIERFQVSISNGNSIYIDVPQVSGSGAGQNNVGANLGAGTGVYAGKTDTILQFKSLVEGYGIDLTNTSTEITIKADTAQVATLHDVAVVQGDIDAHELADGDLDDTNELQSLTIDSVAITGKERFLLEISDGNTVAFDVDLNTDTQDISIDSAVTTGGQNFTVTLQDGGDVDFFIPTNTDNQTLILDSAIVGSVERFELEVSNGNSVFFDIPQITDTDNQSIDTFTYSSGIITLSLQDDGLPAKTIDISGVNTDNQTLDTFEIVSNVLRASLLNDGLPFNSVDLSSYLDNTDAQNLTIEGSGPTYDIAISGGTDITVQGAGIITLSETPANTLVITGTEIDGSVSNEGVLSVGAGTGTTSLIQSNSSGSATITLTGAGISTVNESGNTITITSTEVDGSISNEGVLGVGAGSGTSATLLSTTSGANAVTINAAGILAITESTSANGGSITLTATEVDGSTSNELQTIANTSNSTTHTATLSNSGGSIQLAEGTGIGLATTGTTLDGIVTITNSAPDQTVSITNGGGVAVSGTYPSFTLTATDQSITNEIQTLDTFEIVSNVLRASLTDDGVPFKSVDLSPYLDNTDTQDLSIDSTTVGSIERFTINLVGSPSISFDVSNTTGTVTSVAATQPAAGITISGSPITGSGTLTFALANDLAGLEGQSGTGIVVRTGDGTYAQRTATVFSSVASTANLAIGNANGVSGNPLISIETDRATNKLFVQAVSTTNLDLNGTETIDGVSVTNGQRVLVAGQTAQEDNGIWDVVSAGAWTRSTDANTSAKIDPGILVHVKLGATYGGTMWRLTTVGPYTVGTTDLVFEEVFKDENPTNELQTIDTLSLSGTVMSLSLEGDGLPASTLDFASIIGSAADVVTLEDSTELKAYTGSATGIILKQAGRQGTFVRVPTTRAHDGFIVFTDGNGNKWQRIMDNVINVKWFGAKGDGVTDDQWAIQAAIDYSIYTDTTIKQVYIPSGEYVIGKTIHLGYGKAYHSVSLMGDGTPSFRGGVNEFNGTTLKPNFSNAPALNIQGARYTRVENISLLGLNDIDGFIYDTSAANINNWIDPAVDAIGDNQRTPYAGITIDGYSGTIPTPSYPWIAYPSYANDTSQYERLYSSQIKINNVGVHKFIAGIVLQPNSDGNGDFCQIEKCIIDRVVYGVSVGNTNSRNFKISDCYIDAYTGITNSTHGNQVGRITVIENCHFGGYQWFELGQIPYLEGFEVNNCYGESFYQLGSIGAAAGSLPAITFNGCDFSQSAAQGTVQNFAVFGGDASFNFNTCSFKGNRIYQFKNPNGAWINFNQCKFSGDVFTGEPGDSVETYHDKYFRAFLHIIGTYPDRIKVNQSRFAEFTETNPEAFPQTDGNGVNFPNTMTYASYWLDHASTGEEVKYKDLGYPDYLGVTSAFHTWGFSGRTFTGKVKTTYKHGIGPGDLLLFRDGTDLMPCMITEIDTDDTITALLMTDYIYDNTSGVFTGYLVDTSLASGNVLHISSRKFLNKRTITGSFTAGSTTVTNVKYVLDNTDAASTFEKYTPLLNADGLFESSLSPVSTDTWVDSVLSASSLQLSEVATRTGTYPIQNCYFGTTPDRTILPVQEIAFGNGYGIKSEAAFNYDSTNNRIGLNTTAPGRQITLATRTTAESGAGILMPSDGTLDADPPQRIEFTAVGTGPYTQRGYIGFDGFSNGGATPKGQALVFGLTTDGQSILGTTSLSENQLAVNNSSNFTIANNLGRLRIQATSAGLYSTDNNWLLTSSSYTTNDASTRLKLGGDATDTSTTKYGLRIFNGFNQPYFSARNDGNVLIGGRTVASSLLFLEPSGSGTNYTGFKAGALGSDTLVYTLPTDAPSAGDVLTWNAGNLLSWSAGGGGTNIYNSDGDVKDGGTVVDVSGNDPIILSLDNDATEVNTMLRFENDYSADDSYTYYMKLVSDQDSIAVYNYDEGMYIVHEGSTAGEGFIITTNQILDLRADSISLSTVPAKTELHYILGQYGGANTVSKIEGTADDQVLVWNETSGGYWEIGTVAGGSFSEGEFYVESQTGTTLDLSTGTLAITKATGTTVNLNLPADKNKVDVYKNGVLLAYTDGTTTRDYSYNDTTEVVTFATALVSSDRITIKLRTY